MALTCLQIVDSAAKEMALGTTISTVIGNTDDLVVQLLGLLNGLGQDLVREAEWQFLDKEYRFTTVFYQYTATTVSGSTTISSMSSTTGLTTTPTYFMVTGSGIPQDTYLVSVNAGASTAVLSQAATASGSVTLTFAQVMYTKPSDFDRIVDQTEWDKTNHWEQLGPTSAPGWQWLKSGYIATGPRIRFRILGNLYQIWPPQGDDLYLGFEYISNQWVLAAAATTTSKSSFTVDTDTCIYPDRLMVESLKLRYRRETGKNLAGYSPQDIERGWLCRLVETAKTADKGNPVLSLARARMPWLVGQQNVPDGNWNL